MSSREQEGGQPNACCLDRRVPRPASSRVADTLQKIFLSSEFTCFVAGEIIQVIETMSGSIVPLAMFIFRKS